MKKEQNSKKHKEKQIQTAAIEQTEQKKHILDGKNIAAIDVGSNAVRLIIKNVLQKENGEIETKKLLFLRVPLRLGSDVFIRGKISKEKALKMLRLMKAYRQLMKIYDVADYRACATSAMRDAKNGKEVIRDIAEDSNVIIRILNGVQEARLVCLKHFEDKRENLNMNENYLYVDVGGGSTEISLICQGELMETRSYDIGTIRILAGKVEEKQLENLYSDMERLREGLLLENSLNLPSEADESDVQNGQVTPHAEKEIPLHIIGSGGNINKLYRLLDKKESERRIMTIGELQGILNNLKPLATEERQEQYCMKADRADVIVPAAEIFLTIARAIGAVDIHIPKIGLCDGLIDAMIRDKDI